MRKFIQFFILIFLFNRPVSAQTYNWARSIGEFNDDIGCKLKIDNDGNIIVQGPTGGMPGLAMQGLDSVSAYIVKYDSTGNIKWIIPSGTNYGSYWAFNTAYSTQSIDVDDNNNIYVIGYYDNKCYIADRVLTDTGTVNIFLAKLDPNGSVIWVRKIGHNCIGIDITIDRDNNILICGLILQNAQLDSLSLQPYGPFQTSDILIAKFNSSGNLIWAKQAGTIGSFQDVAYSIKTDALNNIYVMGEAGYQASFDSLVLPLNDLRNGFLAKYSPVGNALWVRLCGSEPQSFNVNESGNCYIGGFTWNSGLFDSIYFPANYQPGMFLTKVDANGTTLWLLGNTYSSSSLSLSQVNGITFDGSGNILAHGIFRDSLKVGLNTLHSLSSCCSSFLLQVDTSGQEISEMQSLNTDQTEVQGTGIDSRNCTVAMCGRFRYTPPAIVFGSDSLNYNGGWDSYITSLSLCNVLGVDALSLNELPISFYPNPTTGHLTIDLFDESIITEVSVTNTIGQEIGRTRYSNTSLLELEINGESGLYFVRVVTAKKNWVCRVMKI